MPQSPRSGRATLQHLQQTIYFRAIIAIIALLATTPLTTTATPSQAPLKRRAVTLSIAPTTLMQKQTQKERQFLVDIRNPGDFEKFKIPGSINIPLSFIKTKPFLKTAPVVLIHEGYRYSEPEREAAALNSKGFDIKILEGGLRAWKQKGGPVVGDPFAQRTLNKMPARALFKEKAYENWILIDTTRTRAPQTMDLFPNAVHIPGVTKNTLLDGFIQTLYANAANLKTYQKTLAPPKTLDLTRLAQNSATLSVLIFNETGEGYEDLESAISPACREKVFFLAGGLNAYRRFIKFHRLATRPKADRVKTTGGCATCEEQKKKEALKRAPYPSPPAPTEEGAGVRN